MTVVCVVGGGPAGLAAAIASARAGAGVILLERNGHCGAKLLASGGGRANIGNLLPETEWPARFGRRGRFILPALSRFPRERLCAWLAGLGQPLHAPDGFHLFPVSNSARAVRDALVAEAVRLGVDIRLRCRADAILLRDGAVAGVRAGADVAVCGAALLAAGGRSLPASGSTGDGARLAAAAGHRVTPLFPGLVGLRADNIPPGLAGITLPDAETFLRVKGRAEERGGDGGRELLLTHGGLSGPALLDLSGSVAQLLGESDPPPPDKTRAAVDVRIRWKAGMTRETWLGLFAEWRRRRGGAPLAGLIGERMPRRVAKWLCGCAGAPEAAVPAGLAAPVRDRLAALLSDFPARVSATEGWDRAMSTRGGADVTEIDPGALASRLAPGLFFAGEALDVDGPCGGYNLHWAFASGTVAGESAAGRGR